MRTTLINTILCFFIVLLGISLSSSAVIDNDDYAAAANGDWIDFDGYYPARQLEVRAAKSRFWKRTPHRKFWKRSLVPLAMKTDDMVNSISNQIHQEEKH